MQAGTSPWSLPLCYLKLLNATENLQFTEEESSAVVIEAATAEENSKNWLVGSVITVTPVDEDFVVRIFRSVWKVKNVSAISELRPNFFLIKHVSAEAKDMILKRRPWVVHNELFSIEPFNPAWRANEYFFTTMVVWIWVHKLPLQAMNSEMVLRLGVSVGKALGVDHWIEGGNMGDFLRVLVQVDITKPLRRCVMLGNGQGKPPSPCPLRFEKLPRLCFFCGLVGHELSSCVTKPADPDERKLQYGS
ncbi:hypothetical protein V6N12_057076 [Hibiscus sabdariffa]|uniref:Zinc knuckle CX2CX4HX4C domain-containing protein n=1 Tax=Hibiscus sabdariffa TaxID=183260 RepID=A0ABR2DCY9_9ROSI